MRILLFLLFPIFLSAQINRAYGVIEIGSFPTSSSTGPKFAYRPADSSFYRWVSGNTWVKIVEPSITSDTIFITEQIGTSYVTSGDTINLTPYLLKSDTTSMLVKYIERGDTLGMLSAYIRSAGWGLLKSSYTLRVDSSLLATKLYTNRFLLRSDTTAMLTPYIDGFGTVTRIPIFTGSRTIGDSPISYNSTTKRTTWDSPGVIELPMGTDAQRPSPATTSDFWYNTTSNGIEWYNGTRWSKGLESTANTFTSGSIIFANANGQATQNNSRLRWDDTNFRLTIPSSAGYITSIAARNLAGVGGMEFRAGSDVTYYNGDNGEWQFTRVFVGTQLRFGGGVQVFLPGNDATFVSGTNARIVYRNASNTIRAYAGYKSSPDKWVFEHGTGYVAIKDSRIQIGGNDATTQTYSGQWETTDAIKLPIGTTTQTPTEIGGVIRFNSDSTLYQIFSGGSRGYIATRAYARSLVSGLPTTWLKTELEAGRDVDISGASSTDLRFRNTRLQVDERLKVGRDSFVIMKSTGLTKNPGSSLMSNVFVGGGAMEIRQQVSSFRPILSMELDSVPTRSFLGFRKYNGNSVNMVAIGDGSDLQGAMVFEAFMGKDTSSTCGFSFNALKINSLGGSSQTINADQVRFLTFDANQRTGQQANGNWYWGADKRTVISPTGDSIYHRGNLKLGLHGVGNREAADLSKTQSSYIASFATDGTLLDYPLSSLPNGIYTGSGNLSSYTTRAKVPNNGNLLFSQLFNSNADSTYFFFRNYGGGERAIGFGITDTVSTGYTRAEFSSDGTGEMNWSLQTSGTSGTTTVRALDGALDLITNTGNISLQAPVDAEVQVTGLVRAKQEAYNEITSTSSPQTLSSTYSDNLINQGGTQATFTLNMPASPEDGQVCYITFNNAISTLTIDGNGETIVGSAVVTGVAGSQRKFKFYAGIGWIKQY